MMKVEVIRSARRRKTVQARLVGGTVRVYLPAGLTLEEEQHWVSEMVGRMERRTSADRIDLESRARTLSRQLGLEMPDSIRWVDNQEMRWGSCTPRDRSIRISSKLAKEPAWVIDYVVVHEMAHLSVAGHGPAFWKLVGRYRLAERARGFLMARGMEAEEGAEGGAEDADGLGRAGFSHPGRGRAGEAVAAGREPRPGISGRRAPRRARSS